MNDYNKSFVLEDFEKFLMKLLTHDVLPTREERSAVAKFLHKIHSRREEIALITGELPARAMSSNYLTPCKSTHYAQARAAREVFQNRYVLCVASPTRVSCTTFCRKRDPSVYRLHRPNWLN